MAREQGGVRRRVKHGKDLLPQDDANDTKWSKAEKKMDPSVKYVGAVLLALIVPSVIYFLYQQHVQNIIITPLSTPKIIADNASIAAVSPDRFWGTYRYVYCAACRYKGRLFMQV